MLIGRPYTHADDMRGPAVNLILGWVIPEIVVILYTCANDKMIDYLRITLVAARRHVPDAEIRIIPFDDDLSLTRGLAARVDATIIDPDPYWDRAGKRFYGQKQYRPGVPAFRYFRKFNAFNGRPEQFLFFDANLAILANLDVLFNAYDFAISSVVFSHLALPRQFVSFANPVMQQLNPAMSDGYSCAGFMGRGDAIPRRDFNILLRNRNWSKLFGPAPDRLIFPHCPPSPVPTGRYSPN